MSQQNYQNQIKQLQKKLELVRAYEAVINQAQNLTKGLGLANPELEGEIAQALAVFAQIKIAEQFDPPTSTNIQGTLQANTVTSVFKSEPMPEPPQPQQKPIIIQESDVFKDPLKFVTKFKHWCNRVGKFKDGQGNELQGIITGLTYPTLQVEVEGVALSVSPSDIELVLEKK